MPFVGLVRHFAHRFFYKTHNLPYKRYERSDTLVLRFVVIVFVVEICTNQTCCIDLFMAKFGHVVESEGRVSAVKAGASEVELRHWC